MTFLEFYILVSIVIGVINGMGNVIMMMDQDARTRVLMVNQPRNVLYLGIIGIIIFILVSIFSAILAPLVVFEIIINKERGVT